jgi:hypothetical protein
MTKQTDKLALSAVVDLLPNTGRPVLSRLSPFMLDAVLPGLQPIPLIAIVVLSCRGLPSYKKDSVCFPFPASSPTFTDMDSSFDTSSSSNSWIPAFDVFYNRQEGQDWFPGWNNVEEANALATTRHAAGSVGPSPLPSPSPPTPAVYSFDRWTTALLDSNRHPDLYANHYLGTPNLGPSPNCGFPDSELSSCYSYVNPQLR